MTTVDMTVDATLPLYQLVNIRDMLDGLLAQSEGEVTPDLADLLDQVEGATTEKIERVALYIRELSATADAIDVEKDRLAARAKAKRVAAESLKGYLKAQLERLQQTEVRGLLATVAIQPNGQPSVTTSDEPAILYGRGEAYRPFVKRQDTYTLDRAAVLAAWKNHEPMPAGITVERGSHLRIK